MRKKREERKVYEYFKIDEMSFVGKHKEYVDKLWTQGKIQESYFRRLVDLYAIAAIVGLRVGRKAKEEPDSTDLKRTVQLKQLSDNYQTLITIMRMVLIFDKGNDQPIEKRLENAFMIPEEEDVYKANMELFNSYARGGIEYLYEQLVLRAPDVDDEYTDPRLANIVALLEKPLEESIL